MIALRRSAWSAATLVLSVALVGAAPAVRQATFATPEEAVAALIAAADPFDPASLMEILGPDGIALVVTEDAVQDKNHSAAFAAQAREKSAIVRDPDDPRSASLIVGPGEWPLPIPLRERGGRWSFNTKMGREEVLRRRIGSNELDAIQVCRGYVEAQHEYALDKHDGSAVNQYAQRVISTPGKHDGLVWRLPDGTLQGPVAEEIATAIVEGYSSRFEPYHGYYFKILTRQGRQAPFGALDYVVDGAMIGGFALAAAPAEYRVTGVKTFIVGHDGVVWEKDLGRNTPERFRQMEQFDPDESWRPVEEP